METCQIYFCILDIYIQKFDHYVVQINLNVSSNEIFPALVSKMLQDIVPA